MLEIQRDLKGYGGQTPKFSWPNGAKIAVQFVLNYEEGGENNVLYGDQASEAFLSDIIGAKPIYGARHMSMESLYEYGSRAGVWRVLNLFSDRGLPLTMFAVASAMKQHPDPVLSAMESGHEIASHGLRWIDYQDVPIEVEREHMMTAIQIHEDITGSKPLGWYIGRTSPNSLDLVAEYGGFKYCADDYSDDLPFYSRTASNRQLMIPYTLDCNDMRFATAQGFNSGAQFYRYLKDSFDVLYEEGSSSPKMMSIGLHCRLAGKPGRFAPLQKFVDYILEKEDVWVCRRIDIADFWSNNFSEINKKG